MTDNNNSEPKADLEANKANSKNLRPWFKKKRFIIPIAIVVIILISNLANTDGGDSSNTADISTSSEVSNDETVETPAVSESESAEESQPKTPNRTEVEWEDYDPSVKTNIDALEAEKDCVGLQSQFDTADANSAATMNRTGHGNAKLMAYIDEALKAAGCY